MHHREAITHPTAPPRSESSIDRGGTRRIGTLEKLGLRQPFLSRASIRG
jgi:hypothetical protein